MSTEPDAPRFAGNATALAAELDAIAARHPDSLLQGEGRVAVLKSAKDWLREGYQRAEAGLSAHGSGARATAGMSAMMDNLIVTLAGFAATMVTPLADTARPAILAVGGYGRGKLAPFSDVDLLFLVPPGGSKAVTALVEYLLYLLWDCGLKVGHATRTPDECVRLAREDTTICTTLLERRVLWGPAGLDADLDRRFTGLLTSGTASAYITAKLAERDERHKKTGDTRYLVEPNIKEGKGGLRDIQTLFWMAKYFYRIRDERELVERGVLTRAELRTLIKATDFLWAVRCHLHFLTGKAEERLAFDHQRDIADRLGYHDHPGLSGVERFMKHYFLIAKDVGDLTRILCSALEVENGKSAPSIGGAVLGLFTRRRRKVRNSDFVIDHGRLTVADDMVFESDPVNLIRLFATGQAESVYYHPDALKLASRSLKLVDADLRNDPEANRLFLSILAAGKESEFHLRRMSECGVLGRFVPEFGKIVAMMQFSMYHSYTVDEHTLRTLGNLERLINGELSDAHPLAGSFLPWIESQRKILFVALFLHDIAKGRPEDHSVAGARVAARLCPRFGLTKAETDTVVWLVENHLVMSTIAQTRDLQDRKTIEDFAAVVQSMDRMRLLLVLTICDIRSVGPGVWTGWKGQLLRTLYAETELMLTGGFSDATRDERAAMARDALAHRLADLPDDQQHRYSALFYRNALLAVPPDVLAAHARFIREADLVNRRLATTVKLHPFEGVTEITVLAPDHPRLLSVIAGACSGGGGDIVAAQIFTTTDGRALDTIRIAREFDDDADEMRRANRIGQLIEDVLAGTASLPDTIHRQRKRRLPKAFEIEPKVEVRNALSHRYSVVEVECLNRIGLLAEITRALSDLSLDIESAQITTYGEKVVDTFYVTDLMGFKIDNPQRQRKIVKRLIEVIEDGVPGVGRRWVKPDTGVQAGQA